MEEAKVLAEVDRRAAPDRATWFGLCLSLFSLIVIFAPATKAPVGSVTPPLMDPRNSWEKDTATKTRATKYKQRIRFMVTDLFCHW